MKPDVHIEAIKEYLGILQYSVARGIEHSQRAVGFACSAAAADLFELFLHQQNLIDPGAYIKHNWFASIPAAKKRFAFDFPQKEELLRLLNEIEKRRNLFCYGKQQTAKSIEELIATFNELKRKLELLGAKV